MDSSVSSNLQTACMHPATDISGDKDAAAAAAPEMATADSSGDTPGPVLDSGDLRRRRPAVAADSSTAAIDEDFDSSAKSSLSTSSGEEEVPGGVVGSPAGEGDGGRQGGGQGDGAAAVLRYAYRASAPAHRKVKESPLSSDAIFKQSHAGLFNLCIVVLVAVNSRLIIENLMKYGLLIGSVFWVSSKTLSDWPLFMCCLTLQVLFLAAFLVEKLAQLKRIPDLVVVFLHVVITTTAILYPAFVILRCDSAVLSGLTLMLVACIVWLKLVSYAHTNYDIRAVMKSNKKGGIHVSSSDLDQACNVGFKSLIYFMFAPTLCYQPAYPRTACIRKRWVTLQVIKLVIFTGFMGFIIEQYINPIVQNSQHPLKGNFLYAIERVLKLSVPTLYVWLCMFYCFFHLWLNILAELLQFGDREFYRDWWNAKTIEEYWRLWNMPVHKWMVRHVYFPCLRNGLPKDIAVVISFFVSAIFHEVCIGIPCRNFKMWAFIGIMFQIPLVVLTNFLQNRFKNSMVGNMIFWLFFCILGQPMCVLLYYHDLMNQKARNQLL